MVLRPPVRATPGGSGWPVDRPYRCIRDAPSGRSRLACVRRLAVAGSDRAPADASAAGHGADDEHDDDRADDRDHDRADVERSIDRVRLEQDTGKEATDQRADDAEHDVSDDPKALVTLDEEAGDVAGDRPE